MGQAFVLLHQIVIEYGVPWGRGWGCFIQLRAILGEGHSCKLPTGTPSPSWKKSISVLKGSPDSALQIPLHTFTVNVNITIPTKRKAWTKHLLWKTQRKACLNLLNGWRKDFTRELIVEVNFESRDGGWVSVSRIRMHIHFQKFRDVKRLSNHSYFFLKNKIPKCFHC